MSTKVDSRSKPSPVVGKVPSSGASPPSFLDDGQLFLLDNVTWREYEAMGEALRDRPALRMTYDRGSLEIMTTSSRHELSKTRLSKLVETISKELARPYISGGSMTFKRATLKRGFEPDNCYWILHEQQMRGRLDYDQQRDPPPDLTLEIEITRRVVERMAIFAKFKIPEVWRYDGKTLRVNLLSPKGDYAESDSSPTFPGLPIQELAQFLQADPDQSILDWLQAVRAWVRKHRSKG